MCPKGEVLAGPGRKGAALLPVSDAGLPRADSLPGTWLCVSFGKIGSSLAPEACLGPESAVGLGGAAAAAGRCFPSTP